jgi:hypothetical protein
VYIAIGCYPGVVHDFKLYKEAVGGGVDEVVLIQADVGCLGMEKPRPNSETPKRRASCAL